MGSFDSSPNYKRGHPTCLIVISLLRTSRLYCDLISFMHSADYCFFIYVGPQVICTITPASSNVEETHNTLKFANRAKGVEIYASRNRIFASIGKEVYVAAVVYRWPSINKVAGRMGFC
ncbi:hypothetical protein ACS0TY_028194 [Phlomoides rotata]